MFPPMLLLFLYYDTNELASLHCRFILMRTERIRTQCQLPDALLLITLEQDYCAIGHTVVLSCIATFKNKMAPPWGFFCRCERVIAFVLDIVSYTVHLPDPRHICLAPTIRYINSVWLRDGS